MPTTTPGIKVEAVRALGAEVLLEGDAYDDARVAAERIARDSGAVFVHPYDDPLVIAGQGTIAIELLRQHPEPIDAVFVPVGGGGLLAGVLAYLAVHSPRTQVIAVEPDDAACLAAAVAAGRPVELPRVGLFCDGAAVKQVGEMPFAVVRGALRGVITVSVDEICAAIRDVFEDTRVLAEPAGALAIAGMKKWLAGAGGQGCARSLVALVTGANIHFHRLRHISERVELGEKREAIFAVTIPEQQGSFRRLCRALGLRGITEFNYRAAEGDEAHVFVGVQLHGGDEERVELQAELRARGYGVIDLSSNEVALLHTRHLVGGRAAHVEHERLLRFEFPERPGALARFLDALTPHWNISLFHYRNHGAASGRVLAGIQVPPAEGAEFERHLDALGFPWIDESENPAYRLFLR
jgi:threonine dehydratase